MSTFSSRISLFIVIVVLLVLIPFPSESKPVLPITIWPEPTKTNWPNPTASPLSPHFEIQSSHPLLQPSISHYSTLILSHPYHPILPPSSSIITFSLFPPLISLSISISYPHSPLHHSVDESYSLSISSSASIANLTSSTVWGAIHGLETFSQLIWGDPPVVATDIEIFDEPKFAHRGLMLDTSRNFYPKRDILRTIDAMAMNKLNVFHWHVTDAQSFAIVLPSERGLAEEGAYGEGMRYEVEDVREIVQYGLSRGVRVIPEIDMPAHTGSWAPAYPDIVTCADKFWLPDSNDWANRLASEPGTGHLNPLIPETYRVVHNVIRDVASLFPEPFFHAGADEITPGCWKDDPTIQSFLTNGGGTLSQLLETFISFTHPLIVSLNRTAVYWEDVLLDPIVNVDPSLLPKQTTILQTWNNGPRNTKHIVQAGYRAIVSSADFYYLDCGHGGFVGNDSQYDTVTSDDSGSTGGSWCAPFKTWQRVYDYDITYGLSKEEAKLVLGGEVALWSEQSDETVLDARLWPRASAMAETLWSGNQSNGKKKYAEATDRLNDWRDRMVGRGVGAEPIQPRWCRRNPGMCNLVQ